MKVKTSITLSAELIPIIDSLLDTQQNRSFFIETAIKHHIARLRRYQQNQRDLVLINQNAAQLNAELMETLDDQVET